MANKSLAKTVPSRVSPAEQVAERGLVIADEALRHAKISELTIANLNAEQAAVEFRDVIKAGMTEAHLAYDEIVANAKLTYDTARRKLADLLEPFEKADRLILTSINSYYATLKRIADEDARIAHRDQAERERQAEIQRVQERVQLEEQVARQVDELLAVNPNAPVDKLLAQLEDFDDEPPVQPAPMVRVSAPVTSGRMSQQSNWKGSVQPGKEMDVLKQVVSGVLPMTLVEFRGPVLNDLAKLYKNGKKFDGLIFEDVPFTRGVGGRK